MADPRFYVNRGPYTLAEICTKAGVGLPAGADGAAKIDDLASLSGAAATHLTFFTGGDAGAEFSGRRPASVLWRPSAAKRPRRLRIW